MSPGARPTSVPAQASRPRRGLALVEVLAVFALTHLAFRSYLHFTPWGRHEMEGGVYFSTGIILGSVGLLGVVLRRSCAGERLADYGLSLHLLPGQIAAGLLGVVLSVACGALYWTLGVHLRPGELAFGDALAIVLGQLCISVALLWLLRGWDTRRRWLLAGRSLAILTLGLVLSPVLVTWTRGQALAPVVLVLLARFVCAGIGEELFFRGYVQSRLNLAWGRSWQLFGTRFGLGLIVSALLFGAVHALNTVDYFSGSYRFAWWHALTAATVPFGILRERTGGLVAPAILHGLTNSLALLISGQA